MESQKKLLKDILVLKKDLESNDMRLAPGLAGMYGEILIWNELIKRFGKKDKVRFVSGQGRADFVIEIDKKPIYIEAKTSRLKDEGFGDWYGSALNIKRCSIADHQKRTFEHRKKGLMQGDFCYFNYLVFVKLENNFREYKFYVFPREYLWKNVSNLVNRHPRFTSSTHRIILAPPRAKIKMSKNEYKLVKEMEKYKNRWNLIK